MTFIAADVLSAMTGLLSPVQPSISSTESSCGSVAVRPAGNSACIDTDADHAKSAPASAVSPGSAARSAQPSNTCAAGMCMLQTAVREGRAESSLLRVRLGCSSHVQRMLDTGRVDAASAAMDAAQKAAEQVSYDSEWMFHYLQSAKPLLASGYGGVDGEADLLYSRVVAWKAAQNDMKDSLAWAVGKTQTQLDAIRKVWEASMQAYLAIISGRRKGGQQVLPVEFRALVKGYADGFGSMAGCFAAMQTRLEGYTNSATALQQDMAATVYTLIRLVRWCRVSSTAARCWHVLELLDSALDVFLNLQPAVL